MFCGMNNKVSKNVELHHLININSCLLENKELSLGQRNILMTYTLKQSTVITHLRCINLNCQNNQNTPKGKRTSDVASFSN